MTFTPMPYRLAPEIVAKRQQKREAKLHQSFDETVKEVRRERQSLKKVRRNELSSKSVSGRFTSR
ncbi:hypothetical protein G7067_09300 [Leucobacter insecticola]|uniref:Uncharacterized protein n=1 Tax=Leucobacter insecticola TaxID=2714934 RepID=A0A6G8FJN3_9MICO|nr:hypothetical protein [Leucobacter insecticola]QIM16561.1 hypothetical protein G7067_09300 [Leucobacter insecticola]